MIYWITCRKLFRNIECALAHPRSSFFCNRNEVSYYRDEIRSANLALISSRFRLENPASFAVSRASHS